MALTYLEEQKKKQQEALQPAAQQNAQGGLSGVSQNTQAQLQKYQGGYQQTDQAQAAQQNLQTIQQQKPQTYSSKYGAQLDNILQEIQNPGTFKYDFNGDSLFQSYKDVLTQQAKQAQLNAQGNAAALTGGYGNSYGAAAGAQAYQQQLLPLYERMPEYASLARQNYDNDLANRYRALGALQDAENTEYGRYRDTVGDYNTDLDRAREDARYADETGYQRYMDLLNYWQNQAGAENQDYLAGVDNEYRDRVLAEQMRSTAADEDYRNRQLDWNMSTDARDFAAQQEWNEKNFQQSQYEFEQSNKLDWANLEEKQRQFDEELSEDQRQANQRYAVAWVTDILANGQIPSNELLVAAGLSYEDAQKLVAQLATGGGPGGPKPDAGDVGNPFTIGATGYTGADLGLEYGGALGLNYEDMAKASLAAANTYEEGSKERADWENDANLLSGISQAKDTAIANSGKYSGNITQAQYEAALKAAGLTNSREPKLTYYIKDGKKVSNKK